MGTEAYVCSPGAASTCALCRSWKPGEAGGSGGDAVPVRAGASKPSCSTFGVAPVTLMGGAASVNGCG